MPPENRDMAYVWDMLDAALAIQEFVQGKTYQDYFANRMLRSSVEREIEIIGEGAHRVSEELKDSHPEIPWRSIIGQRNVLAHEYDDVRHEAIWRVATRRVPELTAALRTILPDEMENEDNDDQQDF